MFDFSNSAIGDAVVVGKQSYRLTKTWPHVRRDGNDSEVLEWATSCPACGDPFTVTTGRKINWLNRRCQNCRQPGKRVR